jgi:uncharacterized damage-inducible protein DinB
LSLIAEKTRALEEARRKLKEALAGLSDESFNKQPGADDWSPRQITQHLAEVEGRLGFAITRTRGQEWTYGRDNPNFNTTTEALAGLSETRRRLLDAIHGVEEEDWTREQQGREGPYSIGSLVDVQIHHDEDHAQQIGSASR